MARSSYIYLVLDSYSRKMLGAFTVKHEMEKFRERYKLATLVLRFRDNQPHIEPIPLV